ncbi:U3-containing 90S pre-ribosomal complex subunit-domain containing protein [Chytriomyces cf. hyalinus JEL632]|nr:U3-containing 90S pre-ribosomal complex subunit-domain containing protein [Chytriomyces cf. hyalinus JEL632]
MKSADSLDDDYLLDLNASPEPTRTKRNRSEADEDDEDEDNNGPSIVTLPTADDIIDEAPDSDPETTPAATATTAATKKKPKKEHPKKKKKLNTDLEAKSKLARAEMFELAHSVEFTPDGDDEVPLPADRSIESLLAYVTAIKKTSESQILIVTPSAERAITVIPALKPIGKIAKLFARHMKVEEQVKQLQAHAFPVCVGTPNRILKLLEAGALKSENLGYVLLDGTSRDKKLRSFFDIPELKLDVIALLKLVSDNKVIVF